MSISVIERLEQSFVRLIAALDGQSSEEIIAAAASIKPVMIELESTGGWYDSDTLDDRLKNLSKLMNAARYRVNKLTELNRLRSNLLAHSQGISAPHSYQKP